MGDMAAIVRNQGTSMTLRILRTKMCTVQRYTQSACWNARLPGLYRDVGSSKTFYEAT